MSHLEQSQGKAQAAIDALKQGKPDKARAILLELVRDEVADASAYVCLAYACRNLSDLVGATSAIDAALKLEPNNLVALMCKADQLDAAGKPRNAAMFYRKVLESAAAASNIPQGFAPELQRAQAICDEYQRQYQIQLQQELAELANHTSLASTRFSSSLDLLSGKKQIFYQQPKIYYFPELPQIQFYDPSVFPWLNDLEEAYEDIRSEVMQLMLLRNAFEPYVQSSKDRPDMPDNSLSNSMAWSALHLWKDGKIVSENAKRCPKTLAALENVPFSVMQGRAPSIMFSALSPGTRIPPHHGLVNTRLICHLPIIVPPQCGLRVGNETKQVVAGKAWVFDDTMEHEAWNLSDEIRIILLFEVWRPELSNSERRLVRSMFAAIDKYQGDASASAWEDR